MRLRSVVLLSVGWMLACGPLQTKGQALQVLCDAPTACEGCAGADPAERATRMAEHINQNVWNGEVRDMSEAMAYASPDAKARILREELASVGITDCALAEIWEQPAERVPGGP